MEGDLRGSVEGIQLTMRLSGFNPSVNMVSCSSARSVKINSA
jgi:hypothetical protein